MTKESPGFPGVVIANRAGGGKSEIRNDMMTGSCYEPSQNVILSKARCRRAKSKDLWVDRWHS